MLTHWCPCVWKKKKNAAKVPTWMLKFCVIWCHTASSWRLLVFFFHPRSSNIQSWWPLTSLITSRLKCNLDQNLITLPDYNIRAPSLTLNIFHWCMKNTQPPGTSASFETERCNYPVFVLPDGLYQRWINYLATVMTTRKSQDGLWGPAVWEEDWEEEVLVQVIIQ